MAISRPTMSKQVSVGIKRGRKGGSAIKGTLAGGAFGASVAGGKMAKLPSKKMPMVDPAATGGPFQGALPPQGFAKGGLVTKYGIHKRGGGCER